MKVAPEILCQVVIKLIEQMGGSIESRDLGRELNRISVDEEGTKALSVIKGVSCRAISVGVRLANETAGEGMGI